MVRGGLRGLGVRRGARGAATHLSRGEHQPGEALGGRGSADREAVALRGGGQLAQGCGRGGGAEHEPGARIPRGPRARAPQVGGIRTLGATRAPADKVTRQDLILRLISEKELGTQQGVVKALAEEGVEAAQATVSRDLAELGVLKVGNRYLALPHEPGSAGIEVLPSFVLNLVPAQNQVVIHTRDGTAGAVSSVLDRVKGLKVLATIAGQDTVLAIAPDNAAAEEVAGLIADVCRARTRPAGNVE